MLGVGWQQMEMKSSPRIKNKKDIFLYYYQIGVNASSNAFLYASITICEVSTLIFTGIYIMKYVNWFISYIDTGSIETKE